MENKREKERNSEKKKSFETNKDCKTKIQKGKLEKYI